MQRHPFFKGVDWEHLYSTQPPYRPAVAHELDTQVCASASSVLGGNTAMGLDVSCLTVRPQTLLLIHVQHACRTNICKGCRHNSP